jgi:hypothetical protein
MRNYKLALSALVAFSLTAGVCATTAANATIVPISNLFNTGVDTSGVPFPDGTIGDPHYTLVSVPSDSTTDIRVRTSAGGYPIPPYLGDDSLSAWIGPNNDSTLDGPVGHYDYETTFTLGAGVNPATASITGMYSTDNELVDILVNGHSTGVTNGSTDTGQYESFWPLSIDNFFTSGTNTLDFILNNDGGPTALRVEMAGTVATVPEPATWVMMLLGFTGLGFAGYRKARIGPTALTA